MKVYNETWLKNAAIQQQAENWNRQSWLTDETLAQIKKVFPDESYQPIIWIKCGLFIFTSIAFSFGSGFFALFGLNAPEIYALVNAIAAVLGLEILIKDKKLRHSGADNALLYIALGAVFGFLFMLFESLNNAIFWGMLPVLAIAVYRYADRLVALALFANVLWLLSTYLFESTVGKMLASFVFMAFAAGVYALVRGKSERFRFLYWADCLWICEVSALVVLYLSGNYAVVRAGSEALLGSKGEIQFAPLFWGFTFLIPVVYVYFGLRKKDRKLLIIGILAMVGAVITFRTYYAIVPVEIALSVGGALMILVAILLIRYLQTERHGLSDAPDATMPKWIEAQSIVLSQITQQTLQQAPDLKFGDGDFGGGGAGEKY